MGDHRASKHKTAKAQGVRESHSIFVGPMFLLVDGDYEVPSLGLKRQDALDARSQFAKRLLALNEDILDGDAYQNLPDTLPEDPLEALEALDGVLRLDKDYSDLILDDMRKLGAPLYTGLSKEMKDALRDLNVGVDPDDSSQDPALTFVYRMRDEAPEAPVLWSMFYQGDQGEYPPDWRKFWGFRLPITQWLTLYQRAGRIEVGHALSAIDEDLYFPRHEISLLTQRLTTEKHAKLAEALKARVRDALKGELAEDQSSAWWEHSETKERGWLAHFLDEQADNELARTGKARAWMREAWQSVFLGQQPYDLIHFACHCTPSEAELLSRLDLKVGGENIPLEVSFMRTNLCRKGEGEGWLRTEQGPLVFLNACATGKQSDKHEFPAFPVEWIDRQGAKAVIVTICEIPDAFAYAFASKFYEILFDAVTGQAEQDPELIRGRYVAEALLLTRKHFMQEYNNPMGLAYELYAVKDALVWNDFPSVGEYHEH
jgi:hypothetical protein